MAGLGIVISRTGPGTGPIIPTPIHDNGVAGATHRYIPERLSLAAGAEVTALPDLIGTANLALYTRSGATGAKPVVAESSGAKYLKFLTGDHDLRGTADMGSTFTFAVVARQSEKNYDLAAVDGYRVKRASDGTWVLSAYTGSATGIVTVSPGSDGFVVLFVVAAGAASRVGANALVSTTAGSITTGDPALSDIVRMGQSLPAFSVTAEINVVEENVWPFALDATQRAAHVSAMKAKWSGLLP
jgi:hypothetical protein